MPHALIRPFSDRATFTVAHVVADAATRRGDDDSRGLDVFIGDTLLMPDHGTSSTRPIPTHGVFLQVAADVASSLAA